MKTKSEFPCSVHHVKAGLGICAGSAVKFMRSLGLIHFCMGLKVLLGGVVACLAIGLLFLVVSALVYVPGMIYLSVTDDTIVFLDMFQRFPSKSLQESALVASMLIYAVLTAIYFMPTVLRHLCELGKKSVIDSDEVQS